MDQPAVVAVVAVLLIIAAGPADCKLTLRLKGRSIPNNGSGRVLITDIGPDNPNALLCLSDQPSCCTGSANWFYKYGTNQEQRVESDDRALGWRRNRGRYPGVVRLRSRKSVSLPGECQEGLYTCEVQGRDIISVGLYYSVEVRMSFQLSSNLLSPQYTITCTSTGGTVLTSHFTGPGGESLRPLSAVGEPRSRGQDVYRSSVTRNNGSHGDTFHCMASNGASTDSTTYTLSAALPPDNITMEQLAPSVVRIRWKQPSGGATVRSYTITTLYGDGVVVGYMTLKRIMREVTLQRLVNDGRTYTITIMAMSDHLPGSSTITVRLGHIDPPTVTLSTVTPTSAHISWTNHTHQGVSSYLIQFSRVNGAGQLGGCPNAQHSGNITANSSELTATLEGLEEASTYMVTCQALSTAMGNSQPSPPVYFTTLGAAPSRSPSNLRAEVLSSSSIRLEWHGMENCLDFNGVALGWQVLYRETGRLARNSTIFIPGSPMTSGHLHVEGLKPFTNYTFRIAAVNAGHVVGVYSEAVTAQTMESVPGPVHSLAETFQNTTTIVVSWQRPTHPGGQIVAYEIAYWTADRLKMSKRENVSGEETLFFLPVPSDAKAGADLVLSVRAFTRMGAGPAKNISISIIHLVPSDTPKFFSVHLVGADMANVSWCRPADITGNVTFHLTYRAFSLSVRRVMKELSMVYAGNMTFALVRLGGGEGDVEHRFTMRYSWSLLGTVHEGDTFNASIVLDKALFQVQIGPMEHCISWTDDKARMVEQQLHVSICSAIRERCPSCADFSESFLRRGVFVCQESPIIASYRSTIVSPGLPGSPNATAMVGIIQEWVSESPSLTIDWLLVRVNSNCPAHIPSLAAPESVTASNSTAAISPFSSELVSACMVELQRLCSNNDQEEDT